MIKINSVLYAREIQSEDLSERVKWINDPDINKTLTFSTPVSIESTKSWFESLHDNDSKVNFTFFIEENGSYIPIGFGGFVSVDFRNRKAELFITIGNRNYQGKGYSKYLVRFLIKYAFESMELNKITLTTLAHNITAKIIYEKCGFKTDSLLEEHFFVRGNYVDCYHMSLLRKNFK